MGLSNPKHTITLIWQKAFLAWSELCMLSGQVPAGSEKNHDKTVGVHIWIPDIPKSKQALQRYFRVKISPQLRVISQWLLTSLNESQPVRIMRYVWIVLAGFYRTWKLMSSLERQTSWARCRCTSAILKNTHRRFFPYAVFGLHNLKLDNIFEARAVICLAGMRGQRDGSRCDRSGSCVLGVPDFNLTALHIHT